MKSLLGFGSGELKMNNIDSSHNNNNNKFIEYKCNEEKKIDYENNTNA